MPLPVPHLKLLAVLQTAIESMFWPKAGALFCMSRRNDCFEIHDFSPVSKIARSCPCVGVVVPHCLCMDGVLLVQVVPCLVCCIAPYPHTSVIHTHANYLHHVYRVYEWASQPCRLGFRPMPATSGPCRKHLPRGGSGPRRTGSWARRRNLAPWPSLANDHKKDGGLPGVAGHQGHRAQGEYLGPGVDGAPAGVQATPRRPS